MSNDQDCGHRHSPAAHRGPTIRTPFHRGETEPPGLGCSLGAPLWGGRGIRPGIRSALGNEGLHAAGRRRWGQRRGELRSQTGKLPPWAGLLGPRASSGSIRMPVRKPSEAGTKLTWDRGQRVQRPEAPGAHQAPHGGNSPASTGQSSSPGLIKGGAEAEGPRARGGGAGAEGVLSSR